MGLPATGALFIGYYKSTGENVQNSYSGQTQAQAATLIAAAFVAGTVYELTFSSY